MQKRSNTTSDICDVLVLELPKTLFLSPSLALSSHKFVIGIAFVTVAVRLHYLYSVSSSVVVVFTLCSLLLLRPLLFVSVINVT